MLKMINGCKKVQGTEGTDRESAGGGGGMSHVHPGSTMRVARLTGHMINRNLLVEGNHK